MDGCYQVKLSVVDSDDEDAPMSGPLVSGAVAESKPALPGLPLLYDGEPITLSHEEAVWIPVRVAGKFADSHGNQVVLPAEESTVEVLPGVWSEDEAEGMVCIVNNDPFDVAVETGAKVGEVHQAAVQTRVCQACACIDTDAWLLDSKSPRCKDCSTPVAAGIKGCSICWAPETECCTLSLSGCGSCRPEKNLKGKVQRGPAAFIHSGECGVGLYSDVCCASR